MISYKLLLLLDEGLIFGILAIGIYIAFQWLRFPDLTPDGSFALGAAAYVKIVSGGLPLFSGLVAAAVAGAMAGLCTATVNRFLRVPSVVAGLLVASALYSVTWISLGKPNQFIHRSLTLAGDSIGVDAAFLLLIWLFGVLAIVLTALSVLGHTLWGLRMRAIGENPLLAGDLGTSETIYTFFGLITANSLVGLAGALFAQRSYSADLNMGIGMTITGLAGMLLGLAIAGNHRRLWLVIASIVLGSTIYKGMIFLALEVGVPAEAFRLISAGVLAGTFFFFRFTKVNFLKGLRWS